MKHLGDITKIDGHKVPIVDCVVGGSPCQDLSVAGKRAGLAGERSGLFMEQIRIVKEMREHDAATRADGFIRPRYMVWENVEGAFSSNHGEDFRAVLEECAKVSAGEAIPLLPMPKNGKWSKSGCIYDEMGRWSIAWTLHDASKWCVPQRRKRISLVCDFNGLTAPEILSFRKGMSGNFEEGGSEGQGTSGASEESVGKTGEPCTLQIRGGCDGGVKGHSFSETEPEPSEQSKIKHCSWDATQTMQTLTANNAGGGQRMPDKQNFTCILSEDHGNADG